jgi:hypothetical protein
MKIIRTGQLLKLALISVLVLVLWLFSLSPIGHAGTEYQTIPTMPPPTAGVTPTGMPGDTPTNPPQPTTTFVQPTIAWPSQTVDATISVPVGTVTINPSSVPGTTGAPGSGTIPVLTITIQSTAMLQTSPSISLSPTITAPLAIEIPVSNIDLYRLLGVIMLLAIVIGIGWYVLSRRRQKE